MGGLFTRGNWAILLNKYSMHKNWDKAEFCGWRGCEMGVLCHYGCFISVWMAA